MAHATRYRRSQPFNTRQNDYIATNVLNYLDSYLTSRIIISYYILLLHAPLWATNTGSIKCIVMMVFNFLHVFSATLYFNSRLINNAYVWT